MIVKICEIALFTRAMPGTSLVCNKIPSYSVVGLAKFFLVKSYKLYREIWAKTLVDTNFGHHSGIFYHTLVAPNLAILAQLALKFLHCL